MSRKFSIRPTDILQSRSRRKCFPRFFVKIPRTFALAKMMNTETSLRECPAGKKVRGEDGEGRYSRRSGYRSFDARLNRADLSY